jgi:hypothetical protein
MPRDPKAFRSSFVGISFYNDPHANRLLTSTAQMFDERGQGLIIRGGRAQTDKNDRRVFLARTDDAYTLLRRSLDAYRSQHKQYPARVVLHKTSRFEKVELEGFQEALDETQVDLADFVWISSSSPLRVFRPGGYPVLRGTCISFDKEALLYTRGSVPFFQTYPVRCRDAESTPLVLAREVLLLSEMNWNTSQFDGGLPITLLASREVSKVLRYVPSTIRDVPQYSSTSRMR